MGVAKEALGVSTLPQLYMFISKLRGGGYMGAAGLPPPFLDHLVREEWIKIFVELLFYILPRFLV